MDDYTAAAKFIRDLYEKLAIGQYATIDFDRVDCRTLLAHALLTNVTIIVVLTSFVENNYQQAPSPPQTHNFNHSVLWVNATCPTGSIKIVDERHIAPSDVYNRADMKVIVITEGKIAVVREPGNTAFHSHYSL